MAVCLPKINREKISKALKSGELTIKRLYDLAENERRDLLAKYVGKENATFVNAKFEQAMLSNQKTAFANWVKRTTSRTDPVRRDMLKKIEKQEKFLRADEQLGFMEDLAELKLGTKISEAEAKFLLDTKEKIDELKTKITDDMPDGSAERMAYGYLVDDFDTFIGERVNVAKSLTFKERLKFHNIPENIIKFGEISKSLVATLDNSFIGRQGIKTLLDGKYKIWGSTFIKSFQILGKTIFDKGDSWFKTPGDAQMRTMRAYIKSSENNLNGKYKAAKNGYGLGVLHEEVFPTSIPERVPLLGRLFKASENAFSGSALFMRKKLADAIIKNAEKHGIDMLDPVEATPRGKRVAAMTGRGELGRLGAVGREANALMFSVRFLKSNFDTLLGHLFDKEFTRSARIEAGMSTLRIAGSITALLTIADILGFDVEWDPRSSKSGQICKAGTNNCFDITGGMRGLVTLGSRIVPTFHNGELGFWTKSGTTGKYTKMSIGNFGEQTALDTFENFFEGKLSPSFGMLRDIWRGENFQGEKPNVVNTSLGLITPISSQTLIEKLQEGNDDLLWVMIAEGIGISYSEYSFRGTGKKWEELKEKKGEDVFNVSLKLIQERFNERSKKLQESSRWKKLNSEEQSKELDKIRREETDRIFSKYNIK